ncbi:uncharacterized protein LOC141757323 isoform X3 [Sebastes fasciatus]|uniref:uncharacterized protein LOC141757323 isoform X3 n=1 Tax=Sebastes fasciatus TaxID=394691 RepID=UPI003D9F474F
MKSWSMRVSRALQLSVLLVGICRAHRASPPGGPSASQEAGEVPVAQLRMLSLGLAHLLQGVAENAEQLEQRGDQVAAELDGTTKSLEGLRKQSLQAGRTHKQVRQELQIMSARGDRLWRAARDLQKVKSLTEPRSGGQTQPDISSMKVIIDKQARRLASLTSEVSARDRLIDRRLRHIDHLEKQVSESFPAALRADSDSDCV